MPNLTRVIDFGDIAYDGHIPARNNARVTLELRDTTKGPEVSICGEIWEPKGTRNRDWLNGGQNLDTMREYLSENPTFMRLYALWSRWHLNGLRAECEHQRQRGEKWSTHPAAQCPDCGYKLGHAWLYEPLPPEVLAEVHALLEVSP